MTHLILSFVIAALSLQVWRSSLAILQAQKSMIETSIAVLDDKKTAYQEYCQQNSHNCQIYWQKNGSEFQDICKFDRKSLRPIRYWKLSCRAKGILKRNFSILIKR